MAKVSRTIQYRYLNREFAGLGDGTLVDAIRSAMTSRRESDVIGEKPRARMADLDQAGQTTLLNEIDGIGSSAPVFSGEVVLYRQGFDVPAISEMVDSDLNSFPITQFQTDGESKPVEGVLYFAVIGDHVGIIASNAVRARWLERYLTWLMKDASSIISGDAHIALDANIDLGDSAGSAGPAKELTIHAQPIGRGDDGGPIRSPRHKGRGRGGTVVEVLRTLGIGEDVVAKIVSDVPEGGDLEGDFHVYIRRGRKIEPISVGTVNHAFRNADPEELDIIRRGSKTSGKSTILSEPARVEQVGAVLDHKDAVAKIITQLYNWNTNGIINLGMT